MSWLAPAGHLDIRQQIAVELPTTTAAVIAGEKLSGKTVAILHRARRLRTLCGHSGAQLQIWTASAGVRDLLRSVSCLLDIDAGCIQRYDDWCERVYREAIDAQLPVGPLVGVIAPSVVRTIARYAVNWGFASKPSFDVLLVDEAEAFSCADIAFMAGMTAHITLSATVRDGATDLTSLVQAVGHNEPDIFLTSNYRRNPLIADFAGIIRGSTPRAARPAHDLERESLTYYSAPDFRQEVARLAEVLRERMNRNEQTGILVSDSHIGTILAKELRTAGIGVEVQQEMNREFRMPDFSNKLPKVFTFEAARGLNFETVAIPCLSRRNFRGYREEDLSGLVAEGASLATRWVYFSSSGPSPLRQFERFERLGRPDLLHIAGRRDPTISPPLPKENIKFPTTAIDDLL